ncbi:hypothetical protein [Acuticoccus sediminis]|uniref:hypothetical protein n=1 Tax=Acuticoccus sediminis TaxID=2184697 RepID=UPI001CFE5858|nr:hypothetical protein [Acuticoccus sediminis]
MRAAFIVSLLLHLVILAAAVITLPSSQGFTPPPVAALPIEIITIDEKTDVTEGKAEETVVAMAPAPETVESETEPQPEEMPGANDQESDHIATNEDAIDSQAISTAPEEAGEPEPQPEESEPVDEVMQEPVPETAPEPDPVEAPTETAIAPEPDPARAEPEPAPAAEPEPQPEVAATPPPPVPEKVVPRSRPPRPPRRTQTARQETPREDAFNADQISSLLNRTAASGGGSGRAQASAGTASGRANAAQTATFTDVLMSRLRECWIRPAAVGQEEELAIVVQFTLSPNGNIDRIVDVRARGIGPIFDVAAEAARRAVLKCAPYDWLPADQYNLWQELQVTFDPREFQ